MKRWSYTSYWVVCITCAGAYMILGQLDRVSTWLAASFVILAIKKSDGDRP